MRAQTFLLRTFERFRFTGLDLRHRLQEAVSEPGVVKDDRHGIAVMDALQMQDELREDLRDRGALQRRVALGVVDEVLIHGDVDLALLHGERHLP